MQFLVTALRKEPETWYESPEGVRKIMVCRASGKAPTKACKQAYDEWYLEGMGPDGTCEECERNKGIYNNLEDGFDPTKRTITGSRLDADDLFR
jgi:membrane carboxypeptidase/penicillin-binding protein